MLEFESIVFTVMIAVDQYDLSSLQTILSGAAPLSSSLAQQVGLWHCSSLDSLTRRCKVLVRLARQRKGKEPLAILQGSPFFDVLASVPFYNLIGYGLTETSPNTHLLPEVDSIPKVGSIGLLMPNLEARLLVDGNGNIEAGEGEAGELWLRGPNIMKVCFSFPSQSLLYP